LETSGPYKMKIANKLSASEYFLTKYLKISLNHLNDILEVLRESNFPDQKQVELLQVLNYALYTYRTCLFCYRQPRPLV
jgi:hypothetical protein